MVTTTGELTTDVVMVNSCEWVTPAFATTVAGTAATAGLELDKESVMPPVGAGPVKTTRFEGTEVPPVTVVAERLTEYGVGGSTVRVAFWMTPL